MQALDIKCSSFPVNGIVLLKLSHHVSYLKNVQLAQTCRSNAGIGIAIPRSVEIWPITKAPPARRSRRLLGKWMNLRKKLCVVAALLCARPVRQPLARRPNTMSRKKIAIPNQYIAASPGRPCSLQSGLSPATLFGAVDVFVNLSAFFLFSADEQEKPPSPARHQDQFLKS